MTFEEKKKAVDAEMEKLRADLACARGADPEILRGLVEFKLFAWRPGGFLSACLCNDFARACTQADLANQKRLVTIAQLLYNAMPAACWGNVQAVEAWRGTLFEADAASA